MAGIRKDMMCVTRLPERPVKGKPIIVMSISGGKDSLAMWIRLHKTGTPNLVPVTFDGGWEWDCATTAIKQVEILTGIKCVVLDHSGDFDRILKERGWPAWHVRWCTGFKRDKLERFIHSIKRGNPGFEVLSAIGIAFDERDRQRKAGMKKAGILLPLVKMKIKERECLKICLRAGIDWGGQYLRMDRLSCWCCPWQKLDDWRELFVTHPEKWAKLRAMNRRVPRKRKFRWARYDLPSLGKRLAKEQRSGMI